MTFGVTPEGFKAKKFDDIIQEIASSLRTQLGIDIDSSPDSIAKVITNIYSLALSEEWALPQALQSMFDIDKAEGVHLDNLVKLAGLTRLPASPSSGNQYVTVTENTNIPSGSVFEDVSTNQYLNNNTLNILSSSCVELTLEALDTVVEGNLLTININGTESSILVGADTDFSIGMLVNDINNKTVTNLVTAEDLTGSFKITNVNDLTPSFVTFTNNMIPTEITGFGVVSRSDNGDLSVPAGTVTTPPSGITTIISTTNRYDYTSGSLGESDLDLRNRYKLALSDTGSATLEAIRSALVNTTGVTGVFMSENITEVVDVNSLPPKSFKAVVTGGLDQDIGNTLWENKPAGIETVGDVSVNVVDSQGDTQVVNFSRSTPLYVHVNVNYQLYDEETFPMDGNQQIIDQVLVYGNTLPVGEDVIPQRIATHIFNTVQGLSVVDVTLGTTTLPTDPTPVLTNAIIPVAAFEIASFAESRITAVEV